MGKNSNKAQAQAQAQAQAMEEVQAMSDNAKALMVSTITSNLMRPTKSFVDAMLSVIPDEEEIATTAITIGEKDLQSVVLKKTYVTADTLRKFSEVSIQAMICELHSLTKEIAKADGFTVNGFIKSAFPQYDANTITNYYRVARIFGNPHTHIWKNPIPQGVSVTNLRQVLSLINTDKIDEASEKDLDARLSDFVKKYITTGKIHLLGSNKDLREEISAIKNPNKADIQGKATEVKEGEGTGEEAQAEVEVTPEVAQQEEAQKARDAVNTLYAYFRDNEAVLEALAVVLASIPSEEAQAEEAQAEG